MYKIKPYTLNINDKEIKTFKNALEQIGTLFFYNKNIWYIKFIVFSKSN